MACAACVLVNARCASNAGCGVTGGVTGGVVGGGVTGGGSDLGPLPLPQAANASANEPNQPLALACDAGRYAVSGDPTAITGYGDAGEIIMKRVDHLRVLLGIQNGSNWRYVSVADYMGLATPRPRIMSMQLGILARSAQTVGADSAIANNQVFQVLDQAVTVKTPPAGTPKYVRQVVTQTVAMRNTFGERGRGK